MIRRHAWAWFALYFTIALVYAVLSCRGLRPIVAGDGVEYLGMAEAWFHHQTPNLHHEDMRAVRALMDANLGPGVLYQPDGGFLLDLTGERISWHFWMYPLFVIPAKVVIHALHGNELMAFVWTNRVMYSAAVAIGLCWFPGTSFRRWAFVLLSAVGPVSWYVQWAHPEVFSWSLVMIALVCFANKRTALGAFLASIAAMQNVPIIFLAAAFVAAPFFARRFGRFVTTALACFPAVIPSIFWFINFHFPSTFIECGQAKSRYMSLWRIVDVLFDPSEGMLPYIPGLLLLALIGLIVSVKRRAWVPIVGAVVLFGMMIGATQSVNWNHGCSGILRYAIWMIPLLAWMAAEVPRHLVTRLLVAAALVFQIVVVRERPGVVETRGEDDSMTHSDFAKWVLTHVPAIYNPDPEIFVERTTHKPTIGAKKPYPLPVVFDQDGVATKILTTNAALPKLRLVYDVDPAWLDALAQKHKNDAGMYYANPPRGAVRRRTDILPSESPGANVVLGSEWSAPEWDARGFFWHAMTGPATFRMVPGDTDMMLWIVGQVRTETAERFEVRGADGQLLADVTLDEREVHLPVRIPKAATPGEIETVTLRVTSLTPLKPNEPTFWLAFTHYDPARDPLDTGNPDIKLVSGWTSPMAGVWCAGKHAELSLKDPSSKKMLLHLGGEPSGEAIMKSKIAPRVRITADGRELDHYPLLCNQERDFKLRAASGDRIDVTLDTVVNDEPDAALCLDELTWTSP